MRSSRRQDRDEYQYSTNNRLETRDSESANYRDNNYLNSMTSILNDRDKFNQTSKIDEIDEYEKKLLVKNKKNRTQGEITGNKFNSSDVYDHGMPMRSGYELKKQVYDSNSYFDFDIYNKNNDSNLNVDYFDPNSSSNIDFSSVDKSMKLISKESNTKNYLNENINSLNVFLFNNINKIKKDLFNINGYGLFTTFGLIYGLSEGNTEIELKNYFGFPEKNDSFNNIVNIMDNFKNKYFINENYVLNEKFYRINYNINKMSNYNLKYISLNRNYPDQESNRLNRIIYNEVGCENILSNNTVKNTDISILNVCKFKPKFNINFHSFVESMFLNKGIITYLRFINQSVMYFEDTEKIIFEIPCKGDEISFGFIQYKENYIKNLNEDDLLVNLKNLRTTNTDEILIPRIYNRFKMRLNNMMYNTELKTIFSKLEVPDIYLDNNSKIKDIIQYFDLEIDNNCVKTRVDNRGYRSNVKININRPFTYYIRKLDSNLILNFGNIY